jgi:hypothetical protein
LIDTYQELFVNYQEQEDHVLRVDIAKLCHNKFRYGIEREMVVWLMT